MKPLRSGRASTLTSPLRMTLAREAEFPARNASVNW
jgi:hypothetical protein